MLADLEERRVLARLDKIAFRIDLEEARTFAGDLAAEDEGCAEQIWVLGDRVFFHVQRRPDRISDQPRRLEHGGGAHQ